MLCFARVRELVGSASSALEVDDGASARDAWRALVAHHPALAELADSVRFARGGELIEPAAALRAGDELALLPPVGGG